MPLRLIGLQKYKFIGHKRVNKCKFILIFLFLFYLRYYAMNNKHRFAFHIAALIFIIPVIVNAREPRDKTFTFTVVIDPGHGGDDPGAVYKGICEKNVVLEIGRKLGHYIRTETPDTKVVFTREKDIFIPLHQRAEIANNCKADLFISIHANFCNTPSISGTETFVLGLHRSEENLEVAKKENSVILLENDYTTRYEGFDPNSSESYIMFEMAQDEYMEQSIYVADLIQNQFRHSAMRRNRGVKQAGFLVLRETGMPSILIETGFISSPGEAAFLNSEKGQSKLALAIFLAFKEYKSFFDSKSEFRVSSPKNTEEIVASGPEREKALPESKDPIKSGPLKRLSNQENNKIFNVPGKTAPGAVYFSIQIAATVNYIKPDPAKFKGMKDIYSRQQNGMYKYMYLKESSYKRTKKQLPKVREKFPQAFIVAFRNGAQVPVKDALQNIGP